MASVTQSQKNNHSTDHLNSTSFGLGILMFIGTLVVLYFGFQVLREPELYLGFIESAVAFKITVSVLAILWGVVGAGLLFYELNFIAEALPYNLKSKVVPYIFVMPATFLLVYTLGWPTLRTIYFSFFDRRSDNFVGFDNYIEAFTSRIMLVAFRNNLLWMIFGATLAVIIGLVIATLADRSRFERLAKSLIFLPMAISFVGAGIIWNFIYVFRDTSSNQIGLLNAILIQLGYEPQAWTTTLWINKLVENSELLQRWYEVAPEWVQEFGILSGAHNFFLILIMIWLQAGFAMVIFSAALKGIPEELLEAARVDGASEWTIFFKIMIPSIWGTIITVSTTIVIASLKIFDIVRVMGRGQASTQVIATQFYNELNVNNNTGLASAIAVILLIAVIPVMIYNLRDFSQRETF